MKIVCDACGTKYSIGDDRVAGKVFKIRCKKCSQILVVRGAAPEPIEQPEAPAGEWHLAIDGQQSGPFETSDLQRRHAAGELDDDTLVWRDGMEEWSAFSSIAELAEGTARTSVPEAPELFTTKTVEAFAEPVKPADDKKLLAERNESSVLFTLGNLAKLASTPATGSAERDAPAKGTEGSGLIDIRALAQTYSPKAAPKAASAIGSLDDLPTFGPATFGDPIVMTPVTRGPDRRMMYALLAALAMLAIVAGVLLVVMLRGDKEPEVAATKVEPPPPRVASLAPTTTTTVDAPKPAIVTEAPKVETPPAPPLEKPKPPVQKPKPAQKPNVVTEKPAQKPVEKPKPPVVTEKPAAKGPDKVQCEFSGYAEKGCEVFKPVATTTTNSNLPDNLDRAAIAAGLGTIRAQGCGNKSSTRGDVSVQIKINADGGVSAVTVKSSPDPALSACVVAAAQKGTFAKTKRGASFGYVWRF